MAIKTIFLDRDGVINKELNYLYKIQDFEFIKGVFDACAFFQKLNYSIIIISNQSGIGRGLYSEAFLQAGFPSLQEAEQRRGCDSRVQQSWVESVFTQQLLEVC